MHKTVSSATEALFFLPTCCFLAGLGLLGVDLLSADDRDPDLQAEDVTAVAPVPTLPDRTQDLTLPLPMLFVSVFNLNPTH